METGSCAFPMARIGFSTSVEAFFLHSQPEQLAIALMKKIEKINRRVLKADKVSPPLVPMFYGAGVPLGRR